MKLHWGAFCLSLAAATIAVTFNVGWTTFESAVVWLLVVIALVVAAIWRDVQP